MPVERVVAPGHDRHRSLGWLALWWVETFTIHGPGDVQGEPVELDDEFAAYVVDCYALDRSGKRLYDSVFLSRAKGRAKSELAAFIALFEAFGPCRFSHWAEPGETYSWRGETYHYEPGEPVGREIVYPYIRCLATEEGQAGNTYDQIHFNLVEGPLGESLPRDAAGLTRVVVPGGGLIVPSTASSAAKDGGKETHVVYDETHLYVTPDLRRMYDTVRRNMAKRKNAEPWSHETSTMYLPGEGSVAEDTHRTARAIQDGRTRTSRLLFDHREGPADVDLADEAELRAALKEVYGPFAEVMDLDRIVNEIWDPRNHPADSRRYFLNQRTGAEDSWLEEYQVDAAADPTRIVNDRDTIVMGFDGSRGRTDGVADSTVLVGIRVTDGHLFLIKAWEEPEGIGAEKWEVPEGSVDFEVNSAFQRWNVVGFFGDPSGWSEKMATWTAKHGARLKVRVTQEQPIRWKTNQHSRWSETLRGLHDGIVYRKVTFDGSSVLRAHLINARRRPTRSGITISKSSPSSRRKIDGAVAAAYAYAAYEVAIAQGLQTRRSGGTVQRVR